MQVIEDTVREVGDSKMLRLDYPKMKFDPKFTFECGQAFRWRAFDSRATVWVGIIGDLVVRVKDGAIEISNSRGSSVLEESRVSEYFKADQDLNEILESLPDDEILSSAIRQFSGLRLLAQDPWECLISFVCAISKNIPAIKMEVENLCHKFGRPIDSDLGRFYSFPSPHTLSDASKQDLLSCKVGFRWKYIKYIASRVDKGELDLRELKALEYEEARRSLISELSNLTFGVGPKVADCVLLFSLGKLEAFPIDVWMIRCLRKYYSHLPGVLDCLNRKSLSANYYAKISNAVRSYFGKYAGYAQQYLYMKIRTDSVTRGKAQV